MKSKSNFWLWCGIILMSNGNMGKTCAGGSIMMWGSFYFLFIYIYIKLFRNNVFYALPKTELPPLHVIKFYRPYNELSFASGVLEQACILKLPDRSLKDWKPLVYIIIKNTIKCIDVCRYNVVKCEKRV